MSEPEKGQLGGEKRQRRSLDGGMVRGWPCELAASAKKGMRPGKVHLRVKQRSKTNRVLSVDV